LSHPLAAGEDRGVRSIQRLLVVATRPEGDEDLDQRKKKIDEEFHFSVSVRCLPV
jgi:hypothetical protein